MEAVEFFIELTLLMMLAGNVVGTTHGIAGNVLGKIFTGQVPRGPFLP